MFSQRNLKTLLLGLLGLGCAIAFNACTPNQTSRNPSLGSQAVAMAQPPMTGAEINERLLSVLPPLNNAEESKAASWNEPAADSSSLNSPSSNSPNQTGISLANPEPVPTTISAAAPKPNATNNIAQPTVWGNPTSPTTVNAVPPAIASRTANTHYGHYPYAEAYRENLTVAGYYGSRPEQLHQDAAQAFKQMRAAAQRDGVNLMAVSGFRDVGIQSELFAAQTARQGSPELAARISAPPGHSEHHTGFAIDVGDEGYPETDIEVTFEQTPAFRWMAQNAAYYGFELSFPRNNSQGVSYEPWHWRFVGTATAQQVFAQAR